MIPNCEYAGQECEGRSAVKVDGQWMCVCCESEYAAKLANYDGPGDPDGEEMFRDRDAELRDQQLAAQRLK